MHSFTPHLRARDEDRPWHIGLCWAAADRFSREVLEVLAEVEPHLVLGWNQPYDVDTINGYSMPVHGETCPTSRSRSGRTRSPSRRVRRAGRTASSPCCSGGPDLQRPGGQAVTRTVPDRNAPVDPATTALLVIDVQKGIFREEAAEERPTSTERFATRSR